MKAMLDRLYRVFEWLCFGALIIVSYSLIAEITNSIIDANTPEEEIIDKKFVGNERTGETIIIDGQETEVVESRYISEIKMVKPEDMFQLDTPDFGVSVLLFYFLILCYIVIYILNGKVRFLPWK